MARKRMTKAGREKALKKQKEFRDRLDERIGQDSRMTRPFDDGPDEAVAANFVILLVDGERVIETLFGGLHE